MAIDWLGPGVDAGGALLRGDLAALMATIQRRIRHRLGVELWLVNVRVESLFWGAFAALEALFCKVCQGDLRLAVQG